ncbi:MAG: MFS transporter [archaeon GB-1867-035]|nr:MFS transporter [Candidatus Culexmicrobium profundum]
MDRELVKAAYIGIMLFGVISLCGDLIYEGARSVIPPYLQWLGAPGVIFGLAIGFGEFIGYGLRLLSGYLVDVIKGYWLFTILGYTLLIVVPLLAFTNSWELAIVLILIERLAKALRSPARDTLLSHISKSVGAGKAFGLHELMDQIGAVGGPAIIASTLYLSGGVYSQALLMLFIPYLLLILALSTAYTKLRPYTSDLVSSGRFKTLSFTEMPFEFKLYSLSVLLNTAGLIHISLILFRAAPEVASWLLPTIYLVVQAVDAATALIAGLAYDKFGRIVLILPFILSILPSILTFSGVFNLIIIAALLFGVILGMQESIYRAAVADISSSEFRGLAYGLFYVAYGIGYVISGTIYGFLLDNQLNLHAIVYAFILQIFALILLKKSIGSSMPSGE